MTDRGSLGVKLFADGAEVSSILDLADDPRITGFTTNPTLMRKAGVEDYEGFARKVLDHVTDRPVCFEVFSDDFAEMRRQALRIASWGTNACVKIPVTNTYGVSSTGLVTELSAEGLHLNVTALLSLDQVSAVADSLAQSPRAIVSVFAGRVADTGRDPVPLMAEAVDILSPHPGLELLWASPRDPQCAPGRIGGMPHHHPDRRPPREARRARPRSRGRLVGYGPHVPPRRHRLRLRAVSPVGPDR